jgi:serine/threonine protein kinase
VDFCHSRGVIHRDIKPQVSANILYFICHTTRTVLCSGCSFTPVPVCPPYAPQHILCNRDGTIKLCDFRCASSHSTGRRDPSLGVVIVEWVIVEWVIVEWVIVDWLSPHARDGQPGSLLPPGSREADT